MLNVEPLPERDCAEPDYSGDGDAPKTCTLLASQLQVGDTLVSAALGGVWDAEVLSVRVAKNEVYLSLKDCMPVALECFEVVEIRADTEFDQRKQARAAQRTKDLLEIMKP